MYGLRTVRGMIGVRCPELRGRLLDRFSTVFFNRSFFSVHFYGGCPLLGGSVMRGSIYCIPKPIQWLHETANLSRKQH